MITCGKTLSSRCGSITRATARDQLSVSTITFGAASAARYRSESTQQVILRLPTLR